MNAVCHLAVFRCVSNLFYAVNGGLPPGQRTLFYLCNLDSISLKRLPPVRKSSQKNLKFRAKKSPTNKELFPPGFELHFFVVRLFETFWRKVCASMQHTNYILARNIMQVILKIPAPGKHHSRPPGTGSKGKAGHAASTTFKDSSSR